MIVTLTDNFGDFIANDSYRDQPLCGSVVLTEGEHGTAWQRFFSDGRWHPTRGGGSRTWTSLLSRRNLVLVYDAEERGDSR